MRGKITKGPSKWQLEQALFRSKQNDRFDPEFTMEDGKSLKASILSVGIADGTGDNWIIIATLEKKRTPGSPKDDSVVHLRQRILYQTDTRCGLVEGFAPDS